MLRRGAKGTGMKSIELALSMCDIVDIYGFTVDPGYTEWSAQLYSFIGLLAFMFVSTMFVGYLSMFVFIRK